MTQRRFLARGKAAIAAALVSATMLGSAPAMAGPAAAVSGISEIYDPDCATILGTEVFTPGGIIDLGILGCAVLAHMWRVISWLPSPY